MNTHMPYQTLIDAIKVGDLKLVESFLTKYQINIDADDKDGNTALTLAAINGHYDIVHYLLARGADVNTKDVDGNTALMIAVFYGNYEIQNCY